MGDEHPPVLGSKAPIEFAARGIRYLDDTKVFSGMTSPAAAARDTRVRERRGPSMRNPLDTSSIAQSLDGEPSGGEPACPRIISVAMPDASGKFP